MELSVKSPVAFRAALAEATKHVVLAAAESSDDKSWEVAGHCTEAIKKITEAMRHWNIQRRRMRGH